MPELKTMLSVHEMVRLPDGSVVSALYEKINGKWYRNGNPAAYGVENVSSFYPEGVQLEKMGHREPKVGDKFTWGDPSGTVKTLLFIDDVSVFYELLGTNNKMLRSQQTRQHFDVNAVLL